LIWDISVQSYKKSAGQMFMQMSVVVARTARRTTQNINIRRATSSPHLSAAALARAYTQEKKDCNITGLGLVFRHFTRLGLVFSTIRVYLVKLQDKRLFFSPHPYILSSAPDTLRAGPLNLVVLQVKLILFKFGSLNVKKKSIVNTKETVQWKRL
jgi:hypothetical protein